MGNSLQLISTGDKFFNRTPTALALRSTMNKCDLMKLKNFCKAKDTINWINLQNQKRFLPTPDPIDVFYSKYMKNSRS